MGVRPPWNPSSVHLRAKDGGTSRNFVTSTPHSGGDYGGSDQNTPFITTVLIANVTHNFLLNALETVTSRKKTQHDTNKQKGFFLSTTSTPSLSLIILVDHTYFVRVPFFFFLLIFIVTGSASASIQHYSLYLCNIVPSFSS